MKNNKKKKQNNNGYFKKNIQQNGRDFLNRKTPKDIQRDFRNIMRDIAYSDPSNVSDFVDFFINATFIRNLTTVVDQEYAKEMASFIGLQNYLSMMASNGMPVDPSLRLQENMLISQNKSAAYFVFSTGLNNILNLFSMYPGPDVDYDYWLKANIENVLMAMSAQLKQYKRII